MPGRKHLLGGSGLAFLLHGDPGVLHQQRVGAGGEQVGQLGKVILGELVEEQSERLLPVAGQELLEQMCLLLARQSEERVREPVDQFLQALEVPGPQPLVEQAVLVHVTPGGIPVPPLCRASLAVGGNEFLGGLQAFGHLD